MEYGAKLDAVLGRKIKSLRSYLGLTQKSFGQRLSKSRETILSWERGKTVPKDKTIELICQVYNIHPSWFEAGSAGIVPIDPKSGEETTKPVEEDPKDFVNVRILTLVGLVDLYDLENLKPLETAQLNKDLVINVGRETRIAVRCKGDSMYPTIVDDGIAGVDFNDREPVDNAIFLLRFRDMGLTIKRLRLKIDGYLIVADNPTIKDEFIPRDCLEEGFILGRVRWVYNKL